MQYAFGAGNLFGRSRDSANPTPVRFGAMQGVTLDFQFNVKELYGQFQFPIALGRGTGKISGKANWAQFNAQLFNDIFFGNSGSPTAGTTRTAVAEAKTVTANAVTPTYNGANFVADQGVVRASDGMVYQRVASAPVGLQYSCNESTGAYSFNSTQNNVPVLVSYTYLDAATGSKVSITNQALGTSPSFAAVFTETFNGKSMTLTLNACMSSKLSMATKLEDFATPDFDFMAYSDAAGNIGTISFDE